MSVLGVMQVYEICMRVKRNVYTGIYIRLVPCFHRVESSLVWGSLRSYLSNQAC